jgi:hypothetical protein
VPNPSPHTPFHPHGTTELNNLILLCSRHHHLLHKPGWHSILDADGTLTITTPNLGHTIQSKPPP